MEVSGHMKKLGIVYSSGSPNTAHKVKGAEIDYSVPAAKRGINMLLAKHRKEEYHTEVLMPCFEAPVIPVLRVPPEKAKIALVTDGGLVPKGNPDDIPPANAQKFCIYSFYGKDRLSSEDYEISHQGYNNAYILEDPNRLMPVDALRSLERRDEVGKLSDIFYTLAGVMTSAKNSEIFGGKIARSLKETDVDAVILSSTCGTSTRCGAIIAKEIECVGIPVVQATNLTKIAETVGVNRILRGGSVEYVFGNPRLSSEDELKYRETMVRKALWMLSAMPPENEALVCAP
jgi:glycine reductase